MDGRNKKNKKLSGKKIKFNCLFFLVCCILVMKSTTVNHISLGGKYNLIYLIIDKDYRCHPWGVTLRLLLENGGTVDTEGGRFHTIFVDYSAHEVSETGSNKKQPSSRMSCKLSPPLVVRKYSSFRFSKVHKRKILSNRK